MGRYLDLYVAAEAIGFEPKQPCELSELSDKSPSASFVSAVSRGDQPRPPLDAEGLPVAPCPGCGGRSFWRWPQSNPRHDPRAWFCIRCTPIPLEAGPCDACALPPTCTPQRRDISPSVGRLATPISAAPAPPVRTANRLARKGAVRESWDAETATAIKWFNASNPPTEPFPLKQGIYITDPAAYWHSIATDIAAGPGGARAHYGALQGDLRCLHERFGEEGGTKSATLGGAPNTISPKPLHEIFPVKPGDGATADPPQRLRQQARETHEPGG